MKFHTLRRKQWVRRPLAEVFEFFSDAQNLGKITPPWLGFRILTPTPIRIEVDTRIQYRLMWHGIPVRWTTKIRRWEPPFRFVDVQLAGPYRLWHHTHRFESEDGATRIIDIVRYQLPFGIVGRVMHFLKVGRDVERIFDYRCQRIQDVFGPAPEEAK
ncbi:MAG: SRPBCC family protein [Acidimicrobiia bacterium]|nr:SRPBCC family protein [Acidimicrobiia bacterium]